MPTGEATGRKALVHVGMPKTGSTSIQSWLGANEAGLNRQGVKFGRIGLAGVPVRYSLIEYAICAFHHAGMLFPDAHVRRIYGVQDLDKQAAFARRFDQGLERWLKREQPRLVVISSEHLGAATRKADQARALDTWLSRHFDEVQYLVYFRRQEDWLLSNYSQKLRFGSTERLAEYVEADAVRDHNATLRVWEEAAGPERVAVRLLESEALKNGDLLEDFAEIIGVDPTGFAPQERLKPAFTVATAEFLRQFNAGMGNTTDRSKRTDKFTWQVVKLLDDADPGGRKLVLPQGLIDQVRAANAASNEALRKRRFPERGEMYPARAPGPEEAPDATADEMAGIGLTFLQIMRQQKAAPVLQLSTASAAPVARQSFTSALADRFPFLRRFRHRRRP